MDSLVIRAIHPRWKGALKLSQQDDTVWHVKGTANGIRHVKQGRYAVTASSCTVTWENGEVDRFSRKLHGAFVHEGCNVVDAEELIGLRLSQNTTVYPSRVSVPVDAAGYEVSLRLHTSDIPTFRQVFTKLEYENPSLPGSAGAVVDLGANVGFAAVYFGLRYPEARIICVEPDEDNFNALVSNTRGLGERVIGVKGAIWIDDGVINLQTADKDGLPLGAWGAQVTSDESGASKPTAAYRLATLLERHAFEKVDILKIDIEGAELELFSDAADWLPKVDLIMIETHDRFRPGSEATVRSAVSALFKELPKHGENLIFRRNGL